jgi:hypothetical protein
MLVQKHGKKWSYISRAIDGRNENMVKNRYNSLLKKLMKNKKISGWSEHNKQIIQNFLQNIHSRK